MPEYITPSIIAASSLCAQLIARIRCVTRPDETGRCQMISGCTDHRIDGTDENEIIVQRYDLHGRDVLVMTAKS